MPRRLSRLALRVVAHLSECGASLWVGWWCVAFMGKGLFCRIFRQAARGRTH